MLSGVTVSSGDAKGSQSASERDKDLAMDFILSIDAAPLTYDTQLRVCTAVLYKFIDFWAVYGDCLYMGCTLVAARIKAGRLGWISVGDSPMWRFAGGRLERLNADHSLKTDLEERVRRGEMSAAEAREDPQRHALTSAVTGRPRSAAPEKRAPMSRAAAAAVAAVTAALARARRRRSCRRR